jgi:hypothetical protein
MFMHPVPGPITARFGPRPRFGFHHGIDFGWLLADPAGSKVIYAPTSGTVTVGRNALVGNFLTIATSQGVLRLAHFASIAVKTGQRVVQGVTVLGVMGNTGTQVSGVHLHVDLYRSGVRVNPEPYFTIPFKVSKPIRKKGSTVTAFYCTETDKPSTKASPQRIKAWAVGGDSPGTSANWFETTNQTIANGLASQHLAGGSWIHLTKASFANMKARYLEPVKTASSSTPAA